MRRFARLMNKGEYFKEIVHSAFLGAEWMTLELPAWFSLDREELQVTDLDSNRGLG